MVRAARGRELPTEITAGAVVLGYEGRDGRAYRARLSFTPEIVRVGPREVTLAAKLAPGQTETFEIRVRPEISPGGAAPPPRRNLIALVERTREQSRAFLEGCTKIETDNEVFTQALYRALADIRDLVGEYGGRQVLTAGLPWYATPFGRDAILTSLQILPFCPEVAADTLRVLAAHQGRVLDPYREEEPGKIMHEIRLGEMARAKEIPHTPYYGTVDATPLFLVLLEETHRVTGDAELVRELMPAARAALGWIDEYGDLDGDGFVEYKRTTSGAGGLANQGWKDSHDGILFPDGAQPVAPIALCEVQGYVYDAKARMARLMRGAGEHRTAEALSVAAKRLRRRIEEAFWVEELGTYALALDGEKRALKTVASNAGHLLFSRVPSPKRAERVAERVFDEGMWSGWGIRTLSAVHPMFNPLSYHNGSVWPHDNSLIAMGLSHYGMCARAEKILSALFETSRHFRLGRLPELFSGLERGVFEFPAHYPVACTPQAWAAGAWFMLLQAILGLSPDAPAGVLHIRSPRLPAWLGELTLRGLRVGQSRVSIRFARVERRCFVDVLDVSGAPLKVQIEL
jgi:glycogen debranching enzyme